MTLTNFESVFHIVPEMILGFAIVLLLLVDVVVSPANRARVAVGLAGTAVIGALVALLRHGVTETNVALFSGMVRADAFGQFFKALILLATLFIIPISQKDSETNRANQSEFYALLLAMALGGMALGSSGNLLMAYLALEMVSLVSYVLTGYLKGDRRSAEASMKYVIFGGVASGAMIYGMSFLFGLTGSLDFAIIGERLAALPSMPAMHLTVFVAATLSLVGFGYKISAVPFHMWCPDVYEGAPTPVTAYFSVVPKLAGFAVLGRFALGALAQPTAEAGIWQALAGVDWTFLVAVIAAATMTVGNLVAIHQYSLKRLFAYSSIAHAGYLLMAVVALSKDGMSAILFYSAAYVVMNLGAFLVVILLREATGSDHIDDLRGLGHRGGTATFVAVCMTVFLFSLTGIPPTGGFVGKVYLFAAIIREGWFWLAIVGLLNSVVALYYYARVLKAMFLDETPASPAMAGSWVGGGSLPIPYLATLAVLAAVTLILGLYWTPLATWADLSSQSLVTAVMK